VWFYVRRSTTAGEVAEWSIAPHSKCGVPKGTGGSNPSLSATLTFIPKDCGPAVSS
jgi:hypothetical protein